MGNFATLRYGFFVAGWGLCYTQPPSCQRAAPSGHPECSALRFSHSKGKGMKGKKKKGGGRSAARKWVTIRVTEEEKMRLAEQAEIAGLSLSEYMRRRFFGGRISACTDLNTIAELRRIGGLLKHNFETLRQAKAPPDIFESQETALRNLTWAIQKIALGCHHDCKENQE